MHINMCVYQLAVTLLLTKDWGSSWSINMVSSDCCQEPQGQHCLINFTTEADGCVFEFFPPESLWGSVYQPSTDSRAQTKALIVKRNVLDSGQEEN